MTKRMVCNCTHCGKQVYLNPIISKWVTAKQYWKCNPTRDFPVRAHQPSKEWLDDLKNNTEGC